MRTTVTFEPDVAAAVEARRREAGIGVSEAVNRLIRAGLAAPSTPKRYRLQPVNLGIKVDVSNIGSVLDLLDES